jgi:microcystin-dependent protein
MANYEATRYDINGTNLTNIQGVSTGLIIPWSAASIPSGFLECNGAAVSRSTYSALFAVISTTYGVGDGTTTFNLPDLTDRTIVNKSNTKNLAQTGGANTVTGTGNVSGNSGNTTLSTAQIPSHTHVSRDRISPPSPMNTATSSTQQTMTSPSTGGGGAHAHGLSVTFTGNATSVLQPYIVLIYIIKT